MSLISWIKNLFAGSTPAKIEQDNSHLAPYKIEPQDAVHSTVVDTTVNWPFPTSDAATVAEPAKPVAAMTPAKKKKPAAKPAAKKAPAKPKAKPAAKKAPKSQ